MKIKIFSAVLWIFGVLGLSLSSDYKIDPRISELNIKKILFLAPSELFSNKFGKEANMAFQGVYKIESRKLRKGFSQKNSLILFYLLILAGGLPLLLTLNRDTSS